VQNGLRPFDIISEVAELDELLGTQASEAIVGSRVDRIVEWLWRASLRYTSLSLTLLPPARVTQL